MKILALATAALLASTSAASAQDVAITDITVVDTHTGALAPHRTVLIRDGRIASINATERTPRGAVVVQGRGKFLVPGLWDMVTHLSWSRASAMPALVANGVTAVRDEGGDLAETAIWSAAVNAGTLVGPTIFQVGPMLNGKSFNRYQYALGSPDQARGAVRLLKFQGVDGLEIERRIPRDVYFALMAEAKTAALPVGGKVSIEVTPMEATTAGQSTIDNLETIYDGLFRAAHEKDVPGAIDAFLAPGEGGDALFEAMRRNGTAVTPCTAIFAYSLAHNDPAAAVDANYRYVAKSNRKALKPVPAEELAEFRAIYPRLLKTIARLQAAGVTVLAGTDIAGDRIPGFSLHDELDTLGKAGLTPLQVLQAATLNPAKVMKRTGDYGAVETGKVADLLLLDADPTKNVAALHQIAGVVLHGRVLDRAALDRQFADAAAQAERS